MIGARRLSEERSLLTQVTAPRGPFPRAGSTSPGWATTTCTQTTPLRAEVVPGAAWSRLEPPADPGPSTVAHTGQNRAFVKKAKFPNSLCTTRTG